MAQIAGAIGWLAFACISRVISPRSEQTLSETPSERRYPVGNARDPLIKPFSRSLTLLPTR
jgi:hypothetical protein